MYLTRIDVGSEEALQERLVDAYAWHRALWKAFPGRDGEDRDFLSRTEFQRARQVTLLLSPSEPVPQRWGQWETKCVPEAFLEQERYLFDLRANPVVSRSREDSPRGTRGKRQPLVRADDLRSWIHRKADGAGFRVDEETLDVGVPLRQPFRKKSGSGVHTRVDFRGVLSVSDYDRFQEAFKKGIGPAKAFGFGLLMLRVMS